MPHNMLSGGSVKERTFLSFVWGLIKDTALFILKPIFLMETYLNGAYIHFFSHYQNLIVAQHLGGFVCMCGLQILTDNVLELGLHSCHAKIILLALSLQKYDYYCHCHFVLFLFIVRLSQVLIMKNSSDVSSCSCRIRKCL